MIRPIISWIGSNTFSVRVVALYFKLQFYSQMAISAR